MSVYSLLHSEGCHSDFLSSCYFHTVFDVVTFFDLTLSLFLVPDKVSELYHLQAAVPGS